jgi:hypothetical protein
MKVQKLLALESARFFGQYGLKKDTLRIRAANEYDPGS